MDMLEYEEKHQVHIYTQISACINIWRELSREKLKKFSNGMTKDI